MLTPNCSGNIQKHGWLWCFHPVSAREHISGVYLIRILEVWKHEGGKCISMLPWAYQYCILVYAQMNYLSLLTHLPLVPHVCISESSQHWFRYRFLACSAPSHYLNQCWLIANWTLRNKLQWNFNQNIKLFIHENVSEITICDMLAILFKGRWVKRKLIKYFYTWCYIGSLVAHYLNQ